MKNPAATASLLAALHAADAGSAVAHVLGRRPAEQASVEDAAAVVELLTILHALGD